MLVCDIEKYKRPALQQESDLYLEPKNGYGALDVAVGLNSLGLPMKN